MKPDQDTINRAMLGDAEAAKQCNAARRPIPCPFCRRDPEMYTTEDLEGPNEVIIDCSYCGDAGIARNDSDSAMLAWNRRADLRGLMKGVQK